MLKIHLGTIENIGNQYRKVGVGVENTVKSEKVARSIRKIGNLCRKQSEETGIYRKNMEY